MLEQIGDPATMRQLTLVNLTGDAEHEWMQSLAEDAGTAQEHVNTVRRLADIQVALEEDERVHALVAYSSPIEEIARALEAGMAPSEALVVWQDFAESLVKLYNKFGKRITVVEDSGVRYSWNDLVKHLQQRADPPLKAAEGVETKPSEGEKNGAGRRNADAGLLLAASHLLTAKRAKTLTENLEAITLPLGRAPYAPRLVETFLTSLQQQQHEREAAEAANVELESVVQQNKESTKAQATRLEAAEKENGLILEQLHKTQEELERYVVKERDLLQRTRSLDRGRDEGAAKIKQLEKKLQELRRGRDESAAKIKQLEKKLQGFRRGRSFRKSQLTELKATLREREEQSKAVEARLHSVEDKLKTARRENKRMKSSRSWKYTKFLRKFNGTETFGDPYSPERSAT